MTEITNQPENNKNAEPIENLGLFESYGTFPVWMLKAIQLATPSFLLAQTPPEETKDNSKA